MRIIPWMRDKEIMQVALQAFEANSNSKEMRLAAGAVMMYQLDIPHDKDGRPAWWDEEDEDLEHPLIQNAVAETRRYLS